MLARLFAPLAVKIFAGIAALALMAALAQTVRIEGFLWLKGFKGALAELVEENGILRLDLERIKLAQEAATLRAIAEKQAAEERAEQERKQSDERLAQARDSARAAAARYAAANRVRAQAEAVDGGAGRADLPCAAALAEGPDGACEDAELLAVTRQDFDDMVDNSIRLQEAVEWAKALE